MRKEAHKILSKPTIPIDIRKKSISELLDDMRFTGFQGRKLGEVFNIWCGMLKEKEITIWLGISGAIIPAGMRKTIAFLIKNRMVDAIVSTGAQIFHDIHETLGMKHYIGSHNVNDKMLSDAEIDRIYDVFADSKEFEKGESFIMDTCGENLQSKSYSSREITHFLGEQLSKVCKDEDSIIVSAYKAGVPIFIPAIGDSFIGISILYANLKYNKQIVVDSIIDAYESGVMTLKSKKTGVIYLGGGVPKDFIQQTAEVAPDLYYNSYIKEGLGKVLRKKLDKGHSYAIQITTDAPHWGGLSGCTFEEAQSWGKIRKKAKKATCFAEITVVLPAIVHGLNEKMLKVTKKRKKPAFSFKGTEISVEY